MSRLSHLKIMNSDKKEIGPAHQQIPRDHCHIILQFGGLYLFLGTFSIGLLFSENLMMDGTWTLLGKPHDCFPMPHLEICPTRKENTFLVYKGADILIDPVEDKSVQERYSTVTPTIRPSTCFI